MIDERVSAPFLRQIARDGVSHGAVMHALCLAGGYAEPLQAANAILYALETAGRIVRGQESRTIGQHLAGHLGAVCFEWRAG